MDWYKKLTNYFPPHEMKHPEQIKNLLEQTHLYKKRETPEYIATYAEFPTFLFIDYLLVQPNIRAKGVGSKVLSTFKEKGKTILLEVEPPDAENHDTSKRIRFYEKNGFCKAEHIGYSRFDEHGQQHSMDIYYWSPEDVSEQKIMRQMATICEEIHNFESEKYYGRMVADPEEVLDWLH